ncbi:transcription factor bHLH54 [Arachis ipaensis]|uniref:BHLH domain-containing protein n=1 Tax=Arachis hypogaea TaxID=3818 RepID=A0A445C889_ARAHY|nr:transcription factor bHLH54 [Arachis ipaensis]XP_025665320.1 transcription factor bHLH54-like [Arachis hypogaea]RYR47177.1 hypothetical protein Ahy_A07g033123 [Arachis hypogaea]
MEAVGVGAFPEGEWDCIYRIFSIEEDGNTEIESMFSPTPNLQYICQESSNSIFDNDFHFHMMMMMMMDNEKNHDGVFVPSIMEEHVTMNEDDKTSENPELPLDNKKKVRVSKDRKDNEVGNKKKQKVESNGKEIEENNAESDGLGTTDNYTALEDDNGTNNDNKEENSGGATSSALNSNGKTRVTRGSATDPQSLYARRRRERINERLRTLQSLVPNGTKVDISTMLKEAVHYVKFLQLQIKLLSSDDLWMYAPIAYNGFDIGLINLSPQQH